MEKILKWLFFVFLGTGLEAHENVRKEGAEVLLPQKLVQEKLIPALLQYYAPEIQKELKEAFRNLDSRTQLKVQEQEPAKELNIKFMKNFFKEHGKKLRASLQKIGADEEVWKRILTEWENLELVFFVKLLISPQIKKADLKFSPDPQSLSKIEAEFLAHPKIVIQEMAVEIRNGLDPDQDHHRTVIHLESLKEEWFNEDTNEAVLSDLEVKATARVQEHLQSSPLQLFSIDVESLSSNIQKLALKKHDIDEVMQFLFREKDEQGNDDQRVFHAFADALSEQPLFQRTLEQLSQDLQKYLSHKKIHPLIWFEFLNGDLKPHVEFPEEKLQTRIEELKLKPHVFFIAESEIPLKAEHFQIQWDREKRNFVLELKTPETIELSFAPKKISITPEILNKIRNPQFKSFLTPLQGRDLSQQDMHMTTKVDLSQGLNRLHLPLIWKDRAIQWDDKNIHVELPALENLNLSDVQIYLSADQPLSKPHALENDLSKLLGSNKIHPIVWIEKTVDGYKPQWEFVASNLQARLKQLQENENVVFLAETEIPLKADQFSFRYDSQKQAFLVGANHLNDLEIFIVPRKMELPLEELKKINNSLFQELLTPLFGRNLAREGMLLTGRVGFSPEMNFLEIPFSLNGLIQPIKTEFPAFDKVNLKEIGIYLNHQHKMAQNGDWIGKRGEPLRIFDLMREDGESFLAQANIKPLLVVRKLFDSKTGKPSFVVHFEYEHQKLKAFEEDSNIIFVGEVEIPLEISDFQLKFDSEKESLILLAKDQKNVNIVVRPKKALFSKEDLEFIPQNLKSFLQPLAGHNLAKEGLETSLQVGLAPGTNFVEIPLRSQEKSIPISFPALQNVELKKVELHFPNGNLAFHLQEGNVSQQIMNQGLSTLRLMEFLDKESLPAFYQEVQDSMKKAIGSLSPTIQNENLKVKVEVVDMKLEPGAFHCDLNGSSEAAEFLKKSKYWEDAISCELKLPKMIGLKMTSLDEGGIFRTKGGNVEGPMTLYFSTEKDPAFKVFLGFRLDPQTRRPLLIPLFNIKNIKNILNEYHLDRSPSFSPLMRDVQVNGMLGWITGGVNIVAPRFVDGKKRKFVVDLLDQTFEAHKKKVATEIEPNISKMIHQGSALLLSLLEKKVDSWKPRSSFPSQFEISRNVRPVSEAMIEQSKPEDSVAFGGSLQAAAEEKVKEKVREILTAENAPSFLPDSLTNPNLRAGSQKMIKRVQESAETVLSDSEHAEQLNVTAKKAILENVNKALARKQAEWLSKKFEKEKTTATKAFELPHVAQATVGKCESDDEKSVYHVLLNLTNEAQKRLTTTLNVNGEDSKNSLTLPTFSFNDNTVVVAVPFSQFDLLLSENNLEHFRSLFQEAVWDAMPRWREEKRQFQVDEFKLPGGEPAFYYGEDGSLHLRLQYHFTKKDRRPMGEKWWQKAIGVIRQVKSRALAPIVNINAEGKIDVPFTAGIYPDPQNPENRKLAIQLPDKNGKEGNPVKVTNDKKFPPALTSIFLSLLKEKASNQEKQVSIPPVEIPGIKEAFKFQFNQSHLYAVDGKNQMVYIWFEPLFPKSVELTTKINVDLR